MTKFNPENQKLVCHDSELCINGNYPTLGELRRAYGTKAPQAWLLPQLYNLSEYCGVKDKLQGQPLIDTAYVIATEYFYLKVTELMLFFHKFKAGEFGRFYGNIDPLVITVALKQFIIYRNTEIDRFESSKRKPKTITPDEVAKANYIAMLKADADKGDQSAIEELKKLE